MSGVQQSDPYWVRIGTDDHDAVEDVLEQFPNWVERIDTNRVGRKVAQIGYVIKTTWATFKALLEFAYERIKKQAVLRAISPGIVH